MIYNSTLPYALAIGMTKQEFMKSKPFELKSYAIAHKIKRKQKDYEDWMLGAYFKSALEVVFSQALSSFSKTKSKVGYVDKPFLEMAEEVDKPLSEDEIVAQREAFVAKLMAMKYNFDNTQGH